LTTIDLSAATDLEELVIGGNSTALTTINAPNLQKVHSKVLIEYNWGLTTINFNSLSHLHGDFTCHWNDFLNDLDLSSLTQAEIITIEENNLLSSLSLGLTERTSDITINSNNSLLSVNLPNLTTSVHSSAFSIGLNPLLTTVFTPILSSLDWDWTISGASLTNINFSSVTNVGSNANIGFSNGKLSSTTINLILNKCISSATTMTSGTIDLRGHTPAAPPTGQGIVDKSTKRLR